MSALAKRYRCEHVRNTNHSSLGLCSQCSAGQGTPTRVTCRCCGGRILIERGLWTVRRWKKGKQYHEMQIISEYKTERGARSHIERNPGENWVWHWVAHGPAEVFERPRLPAKQG